MLYADDYCICTELHELEHIYVFSGICVITKKPHSVAIPAKELYAYRRGGLIQVAMPSLSADEREFLMTGISNEGWKIIFAKDQGEED